MSGNIVRTKHPRAHKEPQASAVAPPSSIESRMSLGRVPSKLRNKQARKAAGQVHDEAPASPPHAQSQQQDDDAGASDLPSVLTADSVWAKIQHQQHKSTGAATSAKSAAAVWENIQERDQAAMAARATKPAAVVAAEAAAGGGQPELHPSYQSTIDRVIGSKGQQGGPVSLAVVAPPVPSEAAPKAAASPTTTQIKRPLVNPEQAAAARAQRMAKRRKQNQQQQQPTGGGSEEQRPEAPAGGAASAAAEAQQPLKDPTQPQDAPSAPQEGDGASAAADQAPGAASGPGTSVAAPSAASLGGLEANAATAADKERDGGAAGALGEGDKSNSVTATDATGTVPEAEQGAGREAEAPESAEDAPELLNPKLTKRMVKNRESAARSRAKKQALTDELRAQLDALKKENEQLKMELAVYKEKEAAEAKTVS